MRQPRGSILVIVLFAMAMLGMMGLSFAYRAGLASRGARRDMLMAKLRSQGSAVAAIAMARLEQDTNAFDHPAEAWGEHAPLATEAWLEDWAEPDQHGVLPEFMADYQVIDEAGKLNLAYASSEAKEKVGLTRDQVAAIQDWADADDDTETGGAENEYYLSLQRPHLCKNAPIEVLEELAMIRGFGARTYLGRIAALQHEADGAFADHGAEVGLGAIELITALGDGKINLNTAPEAVLRALPISEDAVRQIISYRHSPSRSPEDIESHSFRSSEDISQLQGLSNADRAVLDSVGRFGSEYFRILAWAKHRATGLHYEVDVLVHRSEEGLQVLQWRASE